MNRSVYVGWGKKDKSGDRDENNTRLEDAVKLVEYIKSLIPTNRIIWCPFDTDDSSIVIALKREGYQVVNTHIDTGGDFFETEVECSCIISNPPFQNRTKIFKRLYSFNKPFIMLQPTQAFNNQAYVQMLIENNEHIGFLCPEKRMRFIKDGKLRPRDTAFYSFWHCYKIGIKGFMKL